MPFGLESEDVLAAPITLAEGDLDTNIDAAIDGIDPLQRLYRDDIGPTSGDLDMALFQLAAEPRLRPWRDRPDVLQLVRRIPIRRFALPTHDRVEAGLDDEGERSDSHPAAAIPVDPRRQVLDCLVGSAPASCAVVLERREQCGWRPDLPARCMSRWDIGRP